MAQKDNYHVGCLLLDCMRSKDRNDIFQIDAATGEEESYGSALSRSIRLARSMRNFGLKPGDVLALAGRNHLDLHIPHYAALFNGLPVIGIDPLFKYNEIIHVFERCKPRIAFCERNSVEDFKRAAQELGLDCKIVTFDDGDCTFRQFINKYDDNEPKGQYECEDFDADKTYAWLICTSGTTGMSKIAAFLHRPLMKRLIAFRQPNQEKRISLNLSPVHWISSFIMAVMPIYSKSAKLQTSRTDDVTSHVVDTIHKYRPSWLMGSPSTLVSIMRHENKCDLTCFQTIAIAGAKIFKNQLLELKSRLNENALVMEMYGQTESYGSILMPNPYGPLGSCGKPIPTMPVKLVDPDTGNEISEPHVTGEMWYKGPYFAGYYNDPEATKDAFTEDGWLKTGDLLYRDEQNNYFFVERMKMLIKYRNYHINPMEIEELIMTLDGVEEVAVTGIPHELDSEHPVAFVVRQPGADVTADDVKKVVAENLSDAKSLRGGVAFVPEIPKSSTGKVLRLKLKGRVSDVEIL